MRPVADVIWCGVSAPIIQGIFLGLGVWAVGLIVFAFEFLPQRPSAGAQSNYGRAESYRKWAKGLAWPLAVCAPVTVAGYIMLYTDASGKFCAQRFDHAMQLAVFAWTGVAGVTFALLVLIAILRGLARKLGSTKS